MKNLKKKKGNLKISEKKKKNQKKLYLKTLHQLDKQNLKNQDLLVVEEVLMLPKIKVIDHKGSLGLKMKSQLLRKKNNLLLMEVGEMLRNNRSSC